MDTVIFRVPRRMLQIEEGTGRWRAFVAFVLNDPKVTFTEVEGSSDHKSRESQTVGSRNSRVKVRLCKMVFSNMNNNGLERQVVNLSQLQS